LRASRFCIALICLVLGAAIALAATAASASAASASEPVRCAVSDGVIEIPVPPGWESNPRLAEDNAVLAFFDPAGLMAGDDIPIWVIVDRLEREAGTSFPVQARRILEEGKGYGFVPRDSSTVRTADGRTVHAYTFKADADTLHHGLGILESPKGVILIRYQAASEGIWKEQRAAVIAMLKGLRFVKG
jgi:hypothetical protein